MTTAQELVDHVRRISAEPQTIELKSGGLHVMMMDLKKQIKAGERVPLTLSFTAADGSVSTVEVNATAAFAPPTR